jgi:hypothetical protein
MHLRQFAKSLIAFSVVVVGSTASAVAATIVAPTITVNSLTHTFTPASSFPFPRPASSRDSIAFNDGNYTGGGAFTVPSIANGDMVNIRLQATPGKKFVIFPTGTTLSLDVYFQTAGSDSIGTFGGTATFENLVGTAPTVSNPALGVGAQGNVLRAGLSWNVATPIEFTAINISIPVQTFPAAGPRSYDIVRSNSSAMFSAAKTGTPDQTVMAIQPVPEPTAISLLCLSGILMTQRRRSQASSSAATAGLSRSAPRSKKPGDTVLA